MHDERKEYIINKLAMFLWEKQFEDTVWANKIHLIAPRSLQPYKEFAEKLYDIVMEGNKNG